jgi:hypothetical protein
MLELVGVDVADVLQGEVAVLRHPREREALARAGGAARVHDPRVRLRLGAADDALDNLVLPELPLFGVVDVVRVVALLPHVDKLAVEARVEPAG